MRLLALNVGLAFLAIGCSKAHQEKTATAIVRFSDRLEPDAIEKIRQKANAELVATLPRANGEVWRIEPDQVAGIANIKSDSRVRFIEALNQRAAPAFAVASTSVQALSAREQGVVEKLTRKLGPAEYRISGARAAALTADVLDLSAQEQISIPLIADVKPIFAKQNVDRLA